MAYEDDSEPPILTVRAAVQDIAFGSLAGMIAEVFDYPFDLAKVRLQSQLLTPASDSRLRFHGPLDCLTRTWRDEGVRGLYRGLPVPLVGAMVDTAAIFLSYSYFQNLIRTYTYPHHSLRSTDPPPPLSIKQLALAASAAGFAHSFIITPIELVKCKMQVQMMNVTPSSPPVPPIPSLAKGLSQRRLHTATTTTRSFATPSISSTSSIPTSSSTATSTSTSTPHVSRLTATAHPHSTHMHPSSFKSFSTVPPAYNTPYTSLSNTTINAHTKALPNKYAHLPGPLSIIRTTVQSHGLRGLWLGHTGTIIRETGATAAWFATKEWVAGMLVSRRQAASTTTNGTRGKPTLQTWESALSGAVAGAAGVLAVYPVDTVKNAMQTEEELRSHSGSDKSAGFRAQAAKTQGTSFRRTFVRMYRGHGWKGLYAGCGMTVARTVPSSGIVFVVYDGLSAYFA